MSKWILRVFGVLVAGGVVAGGALLVVPRFLGMAEEEQTPVMSDVEFSITEEQNPDFSGSVGDMESIGIEGEPMYEEDGGVAYEIDPVTLERISGPLDIDTHEPVGDLVTEGLDAEVSSETAVAEKTTNPLAVTGEEETPVVSEVSDTEVSVPEEPKVTEEPQETAEETSGITTPTEYTKLPNTGKFLEDD